MGVDAGGTGPAGTTGGTWRFDDAGLLDALEALPLSGIDDLDFGLIVMDRDGTVTGYNDAEAKFSGLPRDGVVGRNFFVEIGPCTNNYLVAQRYQDAPALDEQLDYVFTYRMAPTPVRLRLMSRDGSAR